MAKAKWTFVAMKYRGWLSAIGIAVVAAIFVDAIPLQIVLVLSVVAIGYILFKER